MRCARTEGLGSLPWLGSVVLIPRKFMQAAHGLPSTFLHAHSFHCPRMLGAGAGNSRAEGALPVLRLGSGLSGVLKGLSKTPVHCSGGVVYTTASLVMILPWQGVGFLGRYGVHPQPSIYLVIRRGVFYDWCDGTIGPVNVSLHLMIPACSTEYIIIYILWWYNCMGKP
ncbi:hypothetical protein F4777DRAFT_262555 [Nemania sp. FL0916]|nr:hypothetical protein F4777DRAFT_262555 [Nemania sp. FL0916]